MNSRAFIPLPIGWQSSEQRFPRNKRSEDGTPRTAEWRCNLTGLSVSHNLYFVAYGSEIFVYEPQHPSQALTQPVLIIPSNPSAPNLSGYINLRHPNYINNLLVSYLGTEETVSTVRDDGDVDVFLVRHIAHAVELRSRATEQLSVIADQVHPVFQRNVGASAWGLAIHSHARVIGVSSNRHEVTIFRFGLIQQDNDDDADADDGNNSRQFDADRCVVNGEANIPSIAFCNTGDDPTARWLLTTDIDGICRTVDVHRLEITQSFYFGRSPQPSRRHGYNRSAAGWGLHFLDRRSFAAADTLHDALGLNENEMLPDAKVNPHIWDLGPNARSFPGVSKCFPCGIKETPQSSEEEEDSDDTDEWDTSSEEQGTKPYASYRGPGRLCGFYPRFSSQGPLCDDLPCPVFHASPKNLYLLQPTNSSSNSQARRLLVGMAYPLEQELQRGRFGLNDFERLNMSVYLPEIGILVVASQKGRVLVLALTKVQRSAHYPPELKQFGTRTNYTMRVEGILPHGHQELENKRPVVPLHGIAAGPMQGTESLTGRKKRWRLMLMYHDHSVLSYEICRRVDSHKESPTTLAV